MIILDTSVTSELMKPAPAPVVVAWVNARGPALATTSITTAEIRYGIERLPAGRRKDQLSNAANEIFETFADQVLPFDRRAASEYAAVVSTRDRAGSPIDGFDAQIASICRAHNAVLATRNVKDFHGIGLELLDPWMP
jgi:predicted nucleic acid-binding protein